MIKLVVVEGPDRGRQFELSPGVELIVGRGRQTPTQLADPSVSRQHCTVSLVNGAIILRDAGSGSGTLHNNQPVTESRLSPGDFITVGDTRLTVQLVVSDVERTIPPRRLRPHDSVDDLVEVMKALPPHSATAPAALLSPVAHTPARNLAPLVGTVLHKFKLEMTQHRGNTGTIFRGRHIETGQVVAIKVMWPDLMADDDQRNRFVRAMKTMRPIRHPNIVRILTAGITELGRTGENFCWFAMEFVDGLRLRQYVKRQGTAGMLDWPQTFQIAVQLARALEVAHEHGIVHRNITPDNVLVSLANSEARLMDLMLAKALEGSPADQITRANELVGDVVYMSPERTRGEPIDHRADLYALGATLYFALTGRPPFDASPLPALLAKIQTEQPVPPKDYQLSVNEAFQNIVLTLLAKSPDDRFEHPAQLLTALSRIGGFSGVEVPP